MIVLLLEQGASPSRTMTEKIVRLFELGFSASEVASMLGKKSNYVAAIRTQTRGRKRVSGVRD